MIYLHRSLISAFSSFLEFDHNSAGAKEYWTKVPKLERHMEQHMDLDKFANQSPDFWCLYWNQLWKQEKNELARSHLMAYLQEPCYRIALKSSQNQKSAQCSRAECFQLAITYADRIINKFQPERGYSFYSYAFVTFRNELHKFLFKKQNVNLSSPWSLLRRTSKIDFTASLLEAGWTSETTETYTLIWECYKALWTPSEPRLHKQLREPDPEIWSSITRLYNEKRITNRRLPTATIDTIKASLEQCIVCIRRYLCPPITSLKTSVGTGQDSDDSRTLEDTLPDVRTPSPFEQSERQELSEQMCILIAQLDSQSRELLQLLYGQHLSQKAIASKLGIDQGTVCRRLQRTRMSLATNLLKWAQGDPHISVNPELLDLVMDNLDPWLNMYYNT